MAFWLAGTSRATKLKNKQLSGDKARFAKLQAARRKVDSLVVKVLRDEMPAKLAGQKAARLVPDKKMLRELFDLWDKAAKATPEQIAKENAEIKRREAELAKSQKLLKARGAISDGLTMLFDAAIAGDASAAKNVAEAAIEAAGFLYFLEKKTPELVGPVARREGLWPILASDEAGWEKDAMQRIDRLKLGADMQAFKVRFHKPRGTEINLPARRWAKAAVRTIEETRFRFWSFGQLLRGFGSAGAMADFCLETGWEYGNQPDWEDDVAKLRAFSKEALPAWKLVMRKMIRQQLPDFQKNPEWITQRNSATARGRDSKGEIQNAILDDITSALERLVPDCGLPKSKC